jgi:Family of unknown function (DUF5519)
MALQVRGLGLLHNLHSSVSAQFFLSHRLVASASAIVATFVGLYLRQDYNKFIAIGPGGLPYNIFGWAVSTFILKPIAWGVNLRSTSPYEGAKEPSYLSDDFPPAREGGRPTIGPHPVPHRQLDQLPSEEVKKVLDGRIRDVSERAKHKGIALVRESRLEKHTDALFINEATRQTVSEGAKAAAIDTKGEFAHVHATGDHSVHVLLSPADCKKVLEAGWGERHAFDGSVVVKHVFHVALPMTYVLIYAPRTEEEVEIVVQIVKASMRYMTGHNIDARTSMTSSNGNLSNGNGYAH